MIKVMFVCHGNICRSPMAKYIFQDIVNKNNLTDLFIIDSSATSREEIGNDLYNESKKVLNIHNINYDKHSAKQLKKSDYEKYDYILFMDDYNKYNISKIIDNDYNNKIHKLTHYLESDKKDSDIIDPWYSRKFEECYNEIYDSLTAFLSFLLKKDNKVKIEETVKENLIYKGKILEVLRDDVKVNNKMTVREMVKHPGGVCAIAYNENNEIYLVEQFRYPYKSVILEIPAGKLEKNEHPDVTILRELKEEIGADVETPIKISEIYPTVGYTNEVLHLYFAKIKNLTHNLTDDGEYLNVKKYHINDLYNMILTGEIKDAKTIIGILLFKEKNNL